MHKCFYTQRKCANGKVALFSLPSPPSLGDWLLSSPQCHFSPLSKMSGAVRTRQKTHRHSIVSVWAKKKANKHRCGSWGITLGGALQSLVTDVARPTTRKRTGDGVREHTHTHHSVLLVLFVVRRALTKLTFKIKKQKIIFWN